MLIEESFPEDLHCFVLRVNLMKLAVAPGVAFLRSHTVLGDSHPYQWI